MAALDGVKNAFINKVLSHLLNPLNGNNGSNIANVILTPILGASIDWMKAFRGFQFQNMDESMESAKLVGLLVMSVFLYFVGKKPKPAPPSN